MRRAEHFFTVFWVLLCAAGCASPGNPSFPLTVTDADVALKKMAEVPKPLPRPLLIVGGYLDFGIGPAVIKGRLRELTKDDRIATVSLFTCGDFDDCREQVLATVDEAFPSTDPAWTTEVDVIAVSMGGLAARYAAAPSKDTKHSRRLRIARLFTLSTPHQGAVLANLPSFHALHLEMRQGSQFLCELDRSAADADYPIYPYVRLYDGWVGESHAAPPGRNAWWVSTPWFEAAHAGVVSDPRIMADIARRLRNEPPFAQDPPAPLPE